MPEPLKRTGDIPRFDTYPGPAAQENWRAGREVRSGEAGRQESLNQTAEKIGTAVGTMVNAVSNVRRIPDRWQEKMHGIGDRLRDAGEDMKQDARDAAEEWKQTAQQKVEEARMEARRFAYLKPFHVIGAVAVLALVAGVGLRIWRSTLE
jgi:ElaB/YqjD/DUF883 family membrane-anchored ribosome-binding protein